MSHRQMFSVIIPYYQETTGVLARALRSVYAQSEPGPITVLVVDDSSPIPAESEIPGEGRPTQVTVQVIRQPNGGPAAARNLGLNRVSADTRYVAFLDSDDEWSTDHLASARAALEYGHDFFFANHYQLGQITPAFERAGRLCYPEHPPIGLGGDLHSYRGDMLDQIIRGNVIGTSTVVFDWRQFTDVRFREEFVSAGEDYLCWMEFAHRGARFAFATSVQATYGKGVNVYSGAEWGTARHLVRVQNELRYRKATAALFPVSDAQTSYLQERIAALRSEFANDLLQLIKRGELPPLLACGRQLTEDPATYLAVPRQVFGRFSGRRGNST